MNNKILLIMLFLLILGLSACKDKSKPESHQSNDASTQSLAEYFSSNEFFQSNSSQSVNFTNSSVNSNTTNSSDTNSSSNLNFNENTGNGGQIKDSVQLSADPFSFGAQSSGENPNNDPNVNENNNLNGNQNNENTDSGSQQLTNEVPEFTSISRVIALLFAGIYIFVKRASKE